ncbi:MAG TPA: ABC transporter ATP-binding protein [Mobilitalea sp.]|nr:ABC transporter ATP-binding protein [Mobilitalea sp.]
MREIILSTQKLTKKYKSTIALDNASLEIRQGEIYGLVGKNGAGKTTLLRLITGQAFATDGSISLFGANSEEEINKQRRRMGAIIETPSFYSKLTAHQNLEYYRIQRGIPGRQAVEEALIEVGLADTGDKKYKSFSLGMKQRLGLALALMNKPELLLLDEPINGLDPFGIVELRNLLLKINRERNITILISSHILSELSSIATDFGFINDGKLIRQMSAEEMSKECNKYIKLKVDKVEAMCALLETQMGCTSYKVTPENAIHIYEHLDKPNVISEMAIRNGISLYSIVVRDINLESYFIQMVGGEGNE